MNVNVEPQGSDGTGLLAAFRTQLHRWDVFQHMTNQKHSEEWTIDFQLRNEQHDIFDRLVGDDEVHITLLGVGNGEMELNFLQHALIFRRPDTYKDIHIHCEDPSTEMRNLFFAEVKKRKLVPFSKLDIDFDIHTVEDTNYHMPHSDLIIASHMFYYLTGWKEGNNPNDPLQKIISGLEKRNGAAVIVLQSERSEIWRLRQLYNDLLHNGQTETSSYDVMRALKRLDPPFVEDTSYDSALDVRSLLSDEFMLDEGGTKTRFDPTDEGKALLSFVFRTDWNKIPEPIQKQLGQAILRYAAEKLNLHTQNFKDHSSFLWLKHVDDYIWVRPVFPTPDQRRP